jgi:uncharacterized membrane protein YraQ (UPF0718 family)
MIFILKLKWLQVLTGTAVTALSALLFKDPMSGMAVGIASVSVVALMDKTEGSENREWIFSSWDFARQILPLLAIGIVITGFLLGSTHDHTSIAGIVPDKWITLAVGGNSIFSNLFASVAGVFMYFATLTEVPVVQGLLASGMGKGPALALLLAGPSLSLPSMLVISQVMGTQKTIVYIILVVIMATISGLVFGAL